MTDYFNPITGYQINVPYNSELELNLTASITLSWPTIQQNTQYPVSMNIIVATTTSPSNTITFPNATEASLNYKTYISNLTAGNITLLKNGGGALATIAAGQTMSVLLRDNSTAAGTWLTIVEGAGTSSADAAVLAGYGLKAITTTLNSNYLAPIVSANFTVQTTDRASIKEWSGGAGAIVLQAGSVYGAGFWFGFKILPTGGQVVFTPSSGTINGSSSYTLSPGNSAFFAVDNNLNWITFGDGIPSYVIPSVLNKDILPGTTSFTMTALEQSYIIQNFTSNSGALSATCTITYNPLPNFYLISNLTTGGQNLVITDGSNNFTVSPSQSIFIKNDGTRIYSAVSEIQNLMVLNNLVCLDNANRQVGFVSAGTNSISSQIYTLPTNFPSVSNSLFTSSTTGTMTFTNSNLYSVWAVRGGSVQNLNLTGTTTLIFNSVQFQTTGVTYNNATGVYTVPAAGIYQFNISVDLNIVVNMVAGKLRIYINAGAATSIYADANIATTTVEQVITLSGLLQLSAAATVNITFEVISGTYTTLNLEQGSSLSIAKYTGT